MTAQNIKEPDFAFPKDALADADSLLQVSRKNSDSLGVIRAIMIKTVANNSIDRASMQSSADMIVAEANAQADNQLRGLLQLYAAHCIQTIYEGNRWQYNRRQLPLSPRPADMTEWSGDMFRAVIDSLCKEAWSNVGDMPLKKLTGVVEADNLTLTYYPTLRDFAASRILNDAAVSDELRAVVRGEIVKLQRKDSPAYYNWRAQEILEGDGDRYPQLWELYDGAKDRYAALVVWKYMADRLRGGFYESESRYKQAVECMRSDIASFPDAWITPMLKNSLNAILQPRLNYEVVGDPCPGIPFKIRLNGIRNVNEAQLDFVRIPRTQVGDGSFKGRTYKSVKYNLGNRSIFPHDTVVEAELPSGLYQIRVKLNGRDVPSDSYRYHNSLAVNALMPVFAMSEKETVVTVLDRRNGRVLAGVAYRLKDTKGKVVKRGTTDNDGRFIISDAVRKNLRNVANYELYYRGDTVTGREYISQPGKRESDTQTRFTATTDRGIYNPGDSVDWVLVAMSGDHVVASQRVDIRLKDTEGNVVDSVSRATDAYGRVSGKFTVPKEGKTGRFNITAKSASMKYYQHVTTLTVSDFKAAVAKIDYVYVLPDPQNLTCTVKGKVTNYNGMPAADADVLINAGLGSADEVVTVNGTTDNEGIFDIQFAYPPLRADQSQYGGYGDVELTVTLNTGEVLNNYSSFNPLFPDKLQIAFASEEEGGNIDILKPVRLHATLTDGTGSRVQSLLNWKLLTNDDKSLTLAEGRVETGEAVEINLPPTLSAGYYKLEVAPVDTLLAPPARLYTTYYRTDTSVLPDSTRCIWMPDNMLVIDGDRARAFMGVAADATIVRCSYATEDGLLHFAQQTMPAGYGFFEFQVAAPIVGQVTIYALHNGVFSTEDVSVKKVTKPIVNLSLGSFRDKVFASQAESWTLSFTDADGKPLEGAMVLDVYDYRLDKLASPRALMVQQAQIYGGGMNFSWLSVNNYNVGCSLPFTSLSQTILQLPTWRYSPSIYGAFTNGRSLRIRGTGMVSGIAVTTAENEVEEETVVYSAMNMKMAAPEAMTKKESFDTAAADGATEEVAVDEEAAPESQDFESVQLRTPKSYVALWRPDLVTDAEGRVNVDFTVPNVNTTWRVRGYAWSKNAQMAAVDTLLVTSKPVMIAVNAPRFVRRGDIVVLPVNVTNATDSVQKIAVNVEVATGSGSVFSEITRSVEIGSRSSQTVDIEFTAAAKNVPDSVREITVTARAVSGTFSDGERIPVPVLASESRVTESVNFYMNPGEESVTLDVPNPVGSDFEATLNFTANPMWTVVEALKAQKADDVFSTSTSAAQAYFTNAVILGLMHRYPELELQFDESRLKSNMKKFMGVMKDLQGANGGFRWGSWSRSEDLYSTEAVLEVFAILKRAGMYDGSADAMIGKACEYADSHVLQKDGSTVDVTYSIIRPAFGDILNVDGRRVIANTVNYILKNWKKQEPASKALWACVLWYNNNRNMARELLKSLTQFGTQTPQKGFEFKNVRSLHAYALLLEAYGTVEPQSAEVDGIRQYLIVRRQGEAWERPYLTDEIVRSMIVSGTPWVSTDTEISVTDNGGEKLKVNPEGKTGSFSVPVNGGKVTVSREVATAPAYGAVVARYTALAGEIKAFSDGEISIIKQYVVRNADGTLRNFSPTDSGDQLLVGDRVKVQLTVKSTRPLSNVIVTDNRAATFEPVVQTSGWVYADGTGAYRENRDALTNFYIDYLPQGTFILEYDVTVNNAGSYSSGVAEVTCTRAPDLTAHSSASPILVSAKQTSAK